MLSTIVVLLSSLDIISRICAVFEEISLQKSRNQNIKPGQPLGLGISLKIFRMFFFRLRSNFTEDQSLNFKLEMSAELDWVGVRRFERRCRRRVRKNAKIVCFRMLFLCSTRWYYSFLVWQTGIVTPACQRW